MNEQINNLLEQYKDNEYILKRIHYHITKILPATLKNEKQNWEQRQERNKYLLKEQQLFIQIFLSKHDYYYLPGNSTFYEYDKITYSVIKEDDVHHQLLSSISKDRKLLDWKHKTKFLLLKQIKERNLFHSIPETVTIQHIINSLTPSLFQEKSQTKYFLTILGDNILKKMGDLTFLVKPKMKPLLQELDILANTLFNISPITANIMTKYNESYPYNNCRLIKINNVDLNPSIFKKLGINLFCIAAYYSYNRYTNSDNYLNHVASQEQREYSLFLKNNTQKSIIDSFCQYAIEQVVQVVQVNQTEIYKSKVSISWKKMHYIWKLYISKNSFPFMFYSNTLKSLLKERLQNYDEVTDTFYGVTSKYLPCVQKFLQFWEETIVEATFGYDIDEIAEIFNKWTKNEQDTLTESTKPENISEQDVIKIISHFYPLKVIESGKTIMNIGCSLWNKSIDIELALTLLKETNKVELILIDDAYKYYLKYCRKNKREHVVNKQYFEKYVNNTLQEVIEFDNFISTSKWVSVISTS